jgi:hypothetical protein
MSETFLMLWYPCDGNYGSTTGPWTTDMFIEEVYKEVTAKPAAPAGGKPAAKSPTK